MVADTLLSKENDRVEAGFRTSAAGGRAVRLLLIAAEKGHRSARQQLKKLLDEEGGGMDAFKTTAVALGAANGLAYLEREKIVHGDVTVDSIHLDANGNAKHHAVFRADVCANVRTNGGTNASLRRLVYVHIANCDR
jgi:hypothetical protein